MSAHWIAGSVRAQLLASERTAGAEAAAAIAAARDLPGALALVAQTPYRRGIRADLGVSDAQRSVATTLLLNLRVLAGWLPADALAPLRALAGWFELCNLEDRAAYLTGAEPRRPFELGSLATAWQAAASAESLDELRRTVAASRWGDPDGADAAEFGLGLRFAWARRVVREVPEAQHWAAAAAALLLARELFLVGTPVEHLRVPSLDLLGGSWPSARTYPEFVAAMPPLASWVFAGTAWATDLWHAEGSWWRVLATEGRTLLAGSTVGRRKVVGATAVLAADAHLVAAGLAAAARSELAGAREAFDAAA